MQLVTQEITIWGGEETLDRNVEREREAGMNITETKNYKEMFQLEIQ